MECIKSTLAAVVEEQQQRQALSAFECEPEPEPEFRSVRQPESEADLVGVLDTQTWCVVANHGRNPIASQLVHKLQACGRSVVEVNPYAGPTKTLVALRPETRR